jgi:Co/Zn/Cd efflux system component
MADTLRSIAVLLAAGIASLFPQHITPELADAGAALIVSLIIAMSLVPLFGGLIATFGELRALHHQYALEQEQQNKTIQPMK